MVFKLEMHNPPVMDEVRKCAVLATFSGEGERPEIKVIDLSPYVPKYYSHRVGKRNIFVQVGTMRISASEASSMVEILEQAIGIALGVS